MEKQNNFSKNARTSCKKIITIMKFTVFFILIGIVSVSAESYAQLTRLSLNMQDVTLYDVVSEIEKQSEFMFFYKSGDINDKLKVSIQVKDKTIIEILNEVTKNADLTYVVNDKHILIAKNNALTFQQTNTVTGIVTDINNEPLPGVSVLIKGATQGTATDANGFYTLQIPNENTTLVFTYIGFVSQEVVVGSKKNVNVTLSEDLHQLEEVVVVGYGTMKKRDLTGSVAQMKSEVVANESPKSVQDILRANVAGLSIGYSTGAKPGGSFQIRGRNTLTAGSSPLIVLDGVIYHGGIEDINPADVETVDILKDASSAAVYGAKAASGVVLITTKRGKQGRPLINVSSSVGFATMSVNQPVYDGKGYIKWRSDIAKSINTVSAEQNPGMYDDPFNLPSGVSQQQWLSYDTNDGDLLKTYFIRLYMVNNELENYKNGKETDWYGAVFKPGLQQDYNINLSGKKDEITYFWSLGYTDNEGLIYGDNYSTLRSRASVDAVVTKFLSAGFSTQFAFRDESAIPVDWTQILLASPWGDMYNEDGSYRRYPMDDIIMSANAFYTRSHTERSTNYYTLHTNLYAKITLPFNISFQTNFVPRFQFYKYLNHVKSSHIDVAGVNGRVQRRNDVNYSWQVDNLLKWNKTFGIHSFDVTLLQNAEKAQYWRTDANNERFSPNDLLGYHNIGGGTSPTVSSLDEISTGSAFMARVFYSLMDKYMITGTLRRDGYSAFGQLHPWSNFGSAALAWRFTNEGFWKEPLKNILEDGKIRVSYGTNGNRDIGIYSALSDMNSTEKYWYAEATSGTLYQASQLYVSSMSNKDLRWESTAALNVGLDFTFHKQIIDGSIDVYHGNTTNLLMWRSLPTIIGFTRVMSNMGEVQNSGFELTLNSNNIQKTNLTWRTSFNFSANKNKIKHLYGNMVDEVDANGNVIGQKEADDSANRWFIGKPIDQIWELQPLGVWQTNEYDEARKYGVWPGDFKVYDPDGNYLFEDADRQFLGQTVPKFRWTLRNEFTFFKNFNLSFMMYSYWGQKKAYNRPKNNDTYKDRSSDYVLPYWTPENPINSHARLYSSNGSASYTMYWDNSFIRLDNVSLSYNVPAQLTQKIAIQNLRFNFSIRNAAVWSKKWEFWDPESDGPTPRYFTLGFNMTL